MENVDTEKPTSTTEIAPSNAQGEATQCSPTTAEQTQQPSNDDSKPQEHKVEHEVLTEVCEAKKDEEPSVASEQAGQSAPSGSASSNPSPAPAPPTSSYVPPVKRFSAVSVNKKFLEKASSHTATSGVQAAASISTSKPTATLGLSIFVFSPRQLSNRRISDFSSTLCYSAPHPSIRFITSETRYLEDHW